MALFALDHRTETPQPTGDGTGVYNDIRWDFDANYLTGQYIDGSWYVVAPSGLNIVLITPASFVSVTDVGRVMNGTMVNPMAGESGAQGWDSRSSDNFQAALNKGRPGGNDLSSGNPLFVAAGSSVVTQISMAIPNRGYGNRPMTSDAAVLTVVSAAPPAGSFRPPYCGTNKTHYWNKSDLNYTILGSFAPVTGTPTLATTANGNVRPWIEVVTTWQGLQSQPCNSQPVYGRDNANQTGIALLRLHISDTNANKERAYVNLVQYGIDIYGAAVSGAIWNPDGGHNMGRKAIITLAGKALNDPNILAYADKTQHNIFQDDISALQVDSAIEATIPYNSDGNVRSPFAPKSSVVSISSGAGSPVVITWPVSSANVSISNANPAVITWPNHGLQNTRAIRFASTGSLPAGITAGVTYFVQPTAFGTGDGFLPSTDLTTDTFCIGTVLNVRALYDSDHPGSSGTIIATSSAGSGTFSAKISHGFHRTQPIVFSTTGTLPPPLVPGKEYWIRDPGTYALYSNLFDTFTVGATAYNDDAVFYGGGDPAAINTTGVSGSGIHTASFALTGKMVWMSKGTDYARSGSNFDNNYHGINMGVQFPHALGIMMLGGGKTAWNYPNYFVWVDREVTVSNFYGSPNTFQGYMWQAYRAGLSNIPTLTRYAITWTFDQEYPTGTFINGDPYVIAPSGIKIVGIYPPSVIGNGVANQVGDGKTYQLGRTINGTMVNPKPTTVSKQGIDSFCHGPGELWDPTLNAGRPGGNTLSSSNFLAVAAGSSVLSCVSWDGADANTNKRKVSDGSILTVLASAPPANSFRPTYAGTFKPFFNKASLNYGILRSLAPIGPMPSIASLLPAMARPWMEFNTLFQGLETQPFNNMPEYGRDKGYVLNAIQLRLHHNDSNAAKETLFIQLVQYGIDIYGMAYNGAQWASSGGHNVARKGPLLFAAMALGDAGMQAYCNAAVHRLFQEDQQYFRVDAAIEAEPVNHYDAGVAPYYDKKRSPYTPRSAIVSISNASPAVVTWPLTSATVLFSVTSPTVVTWTGHGLTQGRRVKFSGTLPAGINAGQVYYTSKNGLDANHFKINVAQYDDLDVAATSAGTGTFTGYYGHCLDEYQPIKFTSTGTLPPPLVAGHEYWIRNAGLAIDQFTFSYYATNEVDSASFGGTEESPINTTGAGSGVHTAAFRLLGLADWGSAHNPDQTDPADFLPWQNGFDGSNWDAAYRALVATSSLGEMLSIALIPGAQAICNYDPPFDYMDRAMAAFNPAHHLDATNEYGSYDVGMYNAYRSVAGTGGGTTPPISTGFVINGDGVTGYMQCNKTVVLGASGAGGVTLTGLSGGAVTLTYTSISGGSVNFSLSRTVAQIETGGANAYTQPGDGFKDTSGNLLASFTAHAVTNGSTQGGAPADTTPPTASAFYINVNGTTGYLQCSEPITFGLAGSAGLTVAGLSGGILTLNFFTSVGSILIFNFSRVVRAGETGATCAYSQPGTGIADIAGNLLASFSGKTVINNSIQAGTFVSAPIHPGDAALRMLLGVGGGF